MGLGHDQEVNFVNVWMRLEHVNCGLQTALHRRHKHSCDIDFIQEMSIQNALLYPYFVKVGVAEIKTRLQLLKLLGVIGCLLLKSDVMKVEMAKALSY